MEAIAKTKYLKGSPRKARLVIDLIRGRNVSQALAILKFTDKRAADPIAKTLQSAIANATYAAEQQNIAIDPDDLWVKTCFVDMGPTKNRRRMRPAPQGRAYREQRHYCHITIQVTSEDKPKVAKGPRSEEVKGKKPTAKAESGAEKTKPAAKKAASKVKASDVSGETVKKESKGTRSKKAADAMEAKGTAEAADAKNAKTQMPAELHETKPADDKQQDINEELERQ